MLSADGKPPVRCSHLRYGTAAQSKLNTKVGKSAVIPEPRPIPDLLMITAAETKLDLIIDWQKCVGARIGPG